MNGKIYLGLFILIFIVGIAIKYIEGSNSFLWDIWSALDVASAVSLATLAFLAYRDMIADEEVVKIYFEIDGKLTDTELSLVRREFSRSEVMGGFGYDFYW